MRLDNFDLNLLVAFDALMVERSVTRAAEQLNLTQSAMSAALKRLREAFQDEVLVQSGRSMLPTATALELHPRISAQLLQLRGLLAASRTFDPATSTRKFRIAASDYIATVLLAPLQRHLENLAPSIGMDISLPTEDTLERLSKGEFDLVLSPMGFIAPDHPSDLIFTERQVVVGWKHNPLMAGALEIDAFANARHVAVRLDGRKTYVEQALEEMGTRVSVDVIAPSFVQLAYFLPGTERIALMHERLARLMSEMLPLAITQAPFPIPAMHEMAQYHSARSIDAGLSWFRKQLQLVAGNLPF